MECQKKRALILLCCLAVGLSGCAPLIAAGVGAGVGVGSYKYVDGNLKRDYLGPMPAVWQATLVAMDELNVAANVEEKDHFGGLVKGVMHDGTEIRVKLTRQSENSTEVAVRVGIFGDRDKSEIIHNKIAGNFKKA